MNVATAFFVLFNFNNMRQKMGYLFFSYISAIKTK
jgi:hypothetical protein